MESIWTKTTNIPEYPKLQKDVSVDAVVIGGGLAGLLTAYFLQEQNISTIVLEADRIGSGQTKHTTAKITSQHDLIYAKLLKDFGEDKAKQYAAANEDAISEYQRIIETQNIDCSFEKQSAYLFSQNKQDIESLEQEAKSAESLGIRAEFTTQTDLPFSVTGAVKFHDQAQFHPLKFIQSISKGLNIFEQTKVLTVEDNRILTKYGTITADHIIFATHFPFINMPGFYFARMHQERSYVLALEDTPPLSGMYLGVDSEGLSFRKWNDILLFGGGSHRTGDNSSGGKYAFLRERAKSLYPNSTETGHWSAQDCMTLDGVPYIGQFSASTPNWHVATGFGKWGMTNSMISARLISDRISGIENSYSEVFSPLRFTPSASVKNFITDMGQAVKGLSKRVFSPPAADIEALPAGHGGIIEYEGEKLGAYKDETNEVHLVSVQCPHLHCQVEWNPDEKSWDCPCHGSRFDYKGNLIDNPAQEDLENNRDK